MTTNDTHVDVAALAELAHIEIEGSELKEFEAEFPLILDFVKQISAIGVGVTAEPATPTHRNIMREDTNPTPSGTHTEALISAMPLSKDGYLRVKKVVEHGR